MNFIFKRLVFVYMLISWAPYKAYSEVYGNQGCLDYPLSSQDGSAISSQVIDSLAVENQALIRQMTVPHSHDRFRPMTGTLILPEREAYIHSIVSGVITKEPYLFEEDSYAIEIQTENGHIVRYALLSFESLSHDSELGIDRAWYQRFQVGDQINEGDVLGAAKGPVGLYKRAFLIEEFEGSASGPLTSREFQINRRSDLIKSFSLVTRALGCRPQM